MRMTEVSTVPQIKIERPLYEHDQLRKDLEYEKPKKSFLDGKFDEFKPKKLVTTVVPSIGWLGHYKWKSDLVPDLISGVTVAIMHIPQGMAYALLGNVAPVVGIYMAFFPVFIYAFLGSSRHNSMGTFSIVCLMTGKAVLEYSDPKYFDPKKALFQNATETNSYTPMEVATTVTFVAAIIQLAMYILRLGNISALLSETLVSGFTTGAAIQVLVSQVKYIFGLTVPRFTGNFSVIRTVHYIISSLGSTNITAVIISGVTITITSFNNEILKPIVAKRSAFPVPIELIVVVVGTLVSKYCALHENYGIPIVGDIPAGLPEPQVPQFQLIPKLLTDGFSIAIVSYTITLSMALIFSQKCDYELDANQELLAMGAGNILGSFFSCMAMCASLSRTVIQQVVGGRTQLVSLVSCFILFFILMWIGPFFEPLPKCVLAGVIIVSLKSMFMQVTQFFTFWKFSKMDALVWMGTFLSVVLINIDVGLLVGVLLSLAAIFILGFKPYMCLLGVVPNTDMYLDITRYKGTKEIEGMKIYHYCGGINFATRNIFKSELYNLVKLNPQKEVVYRKKLEQNVLDLDEKKQEKMKRIQGKINMNLKCLVVDFSSVSYIDPSGVTMLKTIIESFQKLNITVYFAGCSDQVYNTMDKCNLISSKKPSLRFFHSVHDAAQNAQSLLGLK